MRIVASIVAVCLVLIVGRARAVQVETRPSSAEDAKAVALVEAESPLPFEFDVETTYIGKGDVERGERGDMVIRDFEGFQGRLRFVLTPMTKIGILRLGLQIERYSFNYGRMAPIPSDLHSTNLIIGLDTELSDKFLIRVEAEPGFYGTDYDDFGRDAADIRSLFVSADAWAAGSLSIQRGERTPGVRQIGRASSNDGWSARSRLRGVGASGEAGITVWEF